MSLKRIDLTTALRPSLLPDEILLFVQNNVGLYEGKFKIPDYQDGHAYLTSHRICYVDNTEPRKCSAGIDLKEVERHEYYAGFLKSSPKITLIPKPPKRSTIQIKAISSITSPSRSGTASPLARADSPFHLPPPEPTPQSSGTWICPICTFSNPVPSNFDPSIAGSHTPLAPCLACGIKPPLAHVLKAAISNAASHTPQQAQTTGITNPANERLGDRSSTADDLLSPTRNLDLGTESNATPRRKHRKPIQCPRCTFSNHPSLLACELCGAPLISSDPATTAERPLARAESPGPVLHDFSHPELRNLENLKLSFRDGGADVFHERLAGAMTQRKWLLQGAPPVPRPGRRSLDGGSGVSGDGDGGTASPAAQGAAERKRTMGIAGLEQQRLELRKNNEIVIGSAFEDLEALMASAKQIVALAESFASQTSSGGGGGSGGGPGGGSSEASALLAQSAGALGLVTTKDMLGSGSSSDTLYLTELSRNLAEFLTDDARGVLHKAGGIISLVDLWAVFNRVRGGVELVSPTDFEKAARLWEKLKLPIRLRQFRSGVLVVQGSDRTDEKTIKALLTWLRDLHGFPPEKEVAWDWQLFGQGVTAKDVAERFHWSIGVAAEELEMAEEKGALCREESIEGLKFWENWIVNDF